MGLPFKLFVCLHLSDIKHIQKMMVVKETYHATPQEANHYFYRFTLFYQSVCLGQMIEKCVFTIFCIQKPLTFATQKTV